GAVQLPVERAGRRRAARAPRDPEGHDGRDARHGRSDRRADGIRRAAVRGVRARGRGSPAAHLARAARGCGADDMTTPRAQVKRLWVQLPFFIWLVVLWMLLWGQLTVLAAVTGI